MNKKEKQKIEHLYNRTIEIIPATPYLSKKENYYFINESIMKIYKLLYNTIIKQDEIIDIINKLLEELDNDR